ncbi:hypothetical protein N7471_002305 [Penicillium samsonianum]|uniref:uncharacterized protein n=1 Tax=Penicillium samsonianum TaxID=1882272 RepID=UPI0025498E8C|nr:uncharacterized protein N7471_002305 [Penicillium samsonianum]KAJ6142852.1 hypothetical protein N7471_002305 [Penicillium samsonianum]
MKRVEEVRALLRLQRRPVVQEVKTKRTVCRDYARWSADDLRRVMDDPQGLARGGDLVKPTEGQMTTVSNVDSASDELGQAVTRFKWGPLSRKVLRLEGMRPRSEDQRFLIWQADR